MHDGLFLHTVMEDEIQENLPADVPATEENIFLVYREEVLRSVIDGRCCGMY